MGSIVASRGALLLIVFLLLTVLPSPAVAFGAGNIPSVAQIEGVNWRHGDIEDMLKTLVFLKGHKWTTMLIKRVYFGNWLRDYSQAVDVGSLKGVSAPVIRILVWVLSFLSFGYATAEFEVTDNRLGVYRPEEHIDNPKDYADNLDARKYDPRLRGPIQPAELLVDPKTGMKNYIANEQGGWATSTGYIRFSLARSVHFGRVYTNGAGGTAGKEADLCEALRCMGQLLHCSEDFSAHTNYCELALRELGYHDVFTHTGNATQINLHGRQVFPLVTGTFGAVDFLHSVLGEATDHFTQTEVDELDKALANASDQSNSTSQRGIRDFVGLVGEIPGVGGGFAEQARSLQYESQAQQQQNDRAVDSSNTQGSAIQSIGIPGMSSEMDPVQLAAKIYPIMEFRDRIVKGINGTIAKIPGLESIIERISDGLTLFVLSLLAPFIRPIINKVSASLKMGSSGVVNASQDQQFGPWNDPSCTDPTHSMLSKDHFSNVLNSCAGRVGATVLQYIVPRVLYAWEHPGVSVEEVGNDILRLMHHPAIRDEGIEIQRNMFNTVRKWVDEYPDRGSLNSILSSSSVKAGKNHKLNEKDVGHSHNAFRDIHNENEGLAWSKIRSRDLGEMQTQESISTNYLSALSSPASPRRTPDFGYSSQFSPPQQTGNPSLRPDASQNYPSYQQGPSFPSYQGYGQPPPQSTYQRNPQAPYWQPAEQTYQGSPGFPGGQAYGGGPQAYGGQPYGGPQYGGQVTYGGPPQPFGGQPPYGAPYGAPYNDQSQYR